ncbi:MAG TPA: hypothetical protein VFN08_15725 [Gemmatimonadales bacterium]|nr:hypothetical protein [Gemmatimonadales bacterium]
MIRTIRTGRSCTRWRAPGMIVGAALMLASCGGESIAPDDSSSASVPTQAPRQSAIAPGIPVGPIGLWTMDKLEWGPGPFTASQNAIHPDTLIKQINAARAKGHRLIMAMTPGPSPRYVTNGQFDMAKWKKAMDGYNKPTLKTAVAAAVADGTIIGNLMIDEPETVRWGNTLTKAKLDQMAVYVKAIFPTLLVGVNHGPPGYKWRSTEHYTKLDYVLYQYAHWVTNGNLTSWKTAVLAQAKADGVKPVFSLNVLNGGKQDRGDGLYDCIGTDMGGLGTRYPNCTMTPTQVRSWGKTLAPLGCAMLFWNFNKPYFSNAANLSAMTDVATLAKSQPRPSCKRP